MANAKRGSKAAAVAKGLALWRDAMRWRRKVDRGLASVGLTFSQWWLLDSTDELTREKQDAVNQNEVATHAEVDRMTVSQVMRTLGKRGWVDREPDMSGRAYRIHVTNKGRKVLRDARACIEAASF